MASTDVARDLVDRLFGRRDPTALDGLVASQAGGSLLRQAVDRYALLSGLGDYGWTTAAAIGEGDWTAVVSVAAGTHVGPVRGLAPTGRPARLTTVDEFRFDGGRITEARLGADVRGLLNQLRAVAPDEPVLELAEIQGNILPGFNKDHQAMVFLEIEDRGRARGWLSKLAGQVATADEVLAFNRLFSTLRKRRGYEGTVEATWLNVALSHAALAKLGADADAVRDVAFREGAAARAQSLGEPAPDDWLIGGPGRPAEVIVILASDDPVDLDEEIARVGRGLDGMRTVGVERGQTLPGDLAGHEHFGFADGISQPGVRGLASPHPDDFVSRRADPADTLEGMPGQALVWPGEFIFGYPRQDPGDPLTPGPLSDGGPDWTRNGSLLTFRRYRQDPRAFHGFWRSTAQRLGVAPELLEAKAVGRWAGGAPLSLTPTADDPELADDKTRNNEFDFTGDADGVACPHAAHIRKAYPRADLDASVHRHRLLRRGIPFGGITGNGDRGLLFLAYQSSVEQQFEFILRHWIDSPTFLRAGTGIDPLIGHAGGGRRFMSLPRGGGRTEEVELPEPWTVPTAGGYFLAPSVSALHVLAGG